MKRWIFFLLLALAGMQGGLCAKRLPHVMRANGDAFLYFVQPFDVPSETKGLPPLNVDITYLTSSDTADVRMSLTWPQWVDAATLTIGGRTYACQQLYVEQTRKGFLHRLHARVPMDELERHCTAESPLRLTLAHGGETLNAYSIPAKKWAKWLPAWQGLFQLIRLNSAGLPPAAE